MQNYEKAEQIMNEHETNLIYPFHINHELKSGKRYYNEKYNDFHEHDFYTIITIVNDDKNAFYLTEEDKEYYSKQELNIIEKIQTETR